MSRINDFGSGIRHLLRGFGFLAATPRLWPWALLPTLINLVLLVVMLVLFIHYYGDIHAWLSAHIGRIDIANPTTWYGHLLDALCWLLDLLLQILVVVVSLLLILLAAYGTGLVIAGPFNDALSERVETIAAAYAPPPFSLRRFVVETIRVIRIETVKALLLLGIPLLLIFLNFIPVIGSPLYLVLTFLFGAWSFGFSYADLPAGRRALPFGVRLAFARSHAWAMVGLGAGFIVPFFGLLFAAPMVVGGTLLYLDRTGCGNSIIPSSSGDGHSEGPIVTLQRPS